MTIKERNQKQREYRKRIQNADTKTYEKTKQGFLVRLYRNMKSRITGVQKEKHHLYQNKNLFDKLEFYQWAQTQEKFHELFTEWEASQYQRKLTPTVDRIDSNKGYDFDNVEWVTHSVNSQRGIISRHSKGVVCVSL